MIFKFLLLKIRIGLRAFKELSFFGIIILLVMGAALLYAFYELCDKEPQRFYLAGALAVLLLSFHLRRNDYYFCLKHLPRPFVLFLSEYFLFTLPFLVISLVKGPAPFDALYLLLPVIIAAIPRIEGHSRKTAKAFRVPMPDLDTVSFFRRCGLFVCCVLVLAAALCFAPAVSVVLVYLLVLFSSGVIYSQCESLTLLCLDGLPARQFLRRKIWRQVRFWAPPVLPVLVLYAVFNWETAYYALIPVVLCPLQITASVCAKYSSYAPGRPFGGTILQAICMLGFLIPLLLPVSIVLTAVYYSDAVRHLKTFLYAYDR